MGRPLVEASDSGTLDFGEGLWRGAWNNTKQASGHWWFRVPAALVTAGFASLGAVLPDDAKTASRVAFAVLGVIGGAITIGVIVLLAMVLVTAIRQRNEAREYARERLPWAIPAELGDHHIAHRSLRITDLVHGSNVILRNRTFDGCDIYGPALLIGETPGMFVHSGFQETPEAVFWEVDPSRHQFAGVIVLENCVFRHCHFVNVGMVGTKEAIRQWLAGFGMPPEPGEE